MPAPPKPDTHLVLAYVRKWEQLEKYRLQESCLEIFFRVLCPVNPTIEHVLLKVSALNDFYSTHVFDTLTVAKHILSLNIDPRLKEHDIALVNEIAKVTIKAKARSFYSFASKYCNHHEPVGYPIYDSYVERMLVYYQKAASFGQFKKHELRSYGKFIETIRQFQRTFKLEECSLREIDIFLWVAGKECFPRKYSECHDSSEASLPQPVVQAQ